MIDVHCHLVDKKFKEDVDEVIQRACDGGVTHVVVLPEYPSQFEAVLALKRKYPAFVIAGIGAHPIQKRNRSVRRDHIVSLASTLSSFQELIGCIGEIGLDFTTSLFKVSEEDKIVQEDIFRQQIRLARDFNLSVAEEDTIRVLIEENYPYALLHAYGGSVETALKAVKAGVLFSIPPCFSLSEKGRSLVEALPLDNLLLETDSPVLGVTKGVRNEPMNCLISAQFIADVKKIPLELVQRITTANAMRLLRI